MSTNAFDISSEITADELTSIISETNEKNYQKKHIIPNNIENVKMLRIYKKKNAIITYFNIIIKRIIDIVGSIIGIIILIPLAIVVAIANLINKDYGPIFYSHKRIGKNGEYFKMYKFRTMVVDADERLAELLKNDKNARKEWEENRKLKNDPRITKVGKFLRKTSLDEWPQFLCVFLRKNEYCRP